MKNAKLLIFFAILLSSGPTYNVLPQVQKMDLALVNPKQGSTRVTLRHELFLRVLRSAMNDWPQSVGFGLIEPATGAMGVRDSASRNTCTGTVHLVGETNSFRFRVARSDFNYSSCGTSRNSFGGLEMYTSGTNPSRLSDTHRTSNDSMSFRAIASNRPRYL